MEAELLPITAFEDEIVAAVLANDAVVIQAETGAGKSTQVPQLLMKKGLRVLITQPRRLAARTVAARVAEEVGCELGDRVGFRTAQDRLQSRGTQCLFVTDGLALVRELVGAGGFDVIIVDELHEWNLNMEVLVAWLRRELERGRKIKVVLMSATLEADKISAYFNGAPVITVPGRMFPVVDRAPGPRIEIDAAQLLAEGHNVLVFAPGLAEINDLIAKIRALAPPGVEILPLHGELEPRDQAQCFISPRVGKVKCVVATNVAQTSVTIPYITAVVDSGTEKRIELADGVRGLYLRSISVADSLQRRGRAGRCQAGIYIDHCEVTMGRAQFPVAEIQRVLLDQTVLRLAGAGVDAEELDFFHQPDKKEIHRAKETLIALGCLTKDGQMTEIGDRVSRLPVGVASGRMIIEAAKLDVLADVITAAAIMEAGDINARADQFGLAPWRMLVQGENRSDVLAQLRLFRAALGMQRAEMLERGIFAKNFFRAKEVRGHLVDALWGIYGKQCSRSTGKAEDILRAVTAGMLHHLYQADAGGFFKNGDGVFRQLNRDSVVPGSAKWIVGVPFDIMPKGSRYGMPLRLVGRATVVELSWLLELAPHLTERQTGLDPLYAPDKKCCCSRTKLLFRGQVIADGYVEDAQHPQAHIVFARWIASQMVGQS